jgi:ParB family chromosome partitioning protein
MAKHTGLGKGLDALIPTGNESASVSSVGGVMQVSVDMIQPNPHQPRVHFHDGDLDELADSIREHGVLQPLVVMPGEDGVYLLIAGERRLQASRRAGLKTVPVITRHATKQELLELALIENIQRADLNALEEAEAYRQLTEEFGLSHEAVAKRVGKNRVTVTNTLRLLGVAPAVKQALVDGKVSEGHARALLGLPSAKAQEAALQTVINLELSVRQTEALVKKLGGAKPLSKQKAGPSPDVNEMEQRLRASLGTKVALRHGKKGGTVTIHYYSDEELDALLGKLL